VIVTFSGTIPRERVENVSRWYPQTADDVAVTEQAKAARTRPGDRIWCEPPPSLHASTIAPGDSFAQWICDSGEGPPADCEVCAVYLSNRRWVVYWTSGRTAYGATLCDDVKHGLHKRHKRG